MDSRMILVALAASMLFIAGCAQSPGGGGENYTQEELACKSLCESTNGTFTYCALGNQCLVGTGCGCGGGGWLSCDRLESQNGCSAGELPPAPPEGNASGGPGGRGDLCTLQYDPVCGADGKTYGNECLAGVAGAEIAHDGECGPSGNGICTKLYNPVCGSDGASYGNACLAKQAGAEISYYGECGREQPGIPCTMQYSPVCGADGVTYGNDCAAGAEGVEIAYAGECNNAAHEPSLTEQELACKRVCEGSGGLFSYCPPDSACKIGTGCSCGEKGFMECTDIVGLGGCYGSNY